MQTFKELEIQVSYGYSDRHSNGPESLIEFLSDFKKDFNYLDIDAVGWDGYAEYSRDGYFEHYEQYLKLKIKPTKEMDLSDIFHFGFFSIKNYFFINVKDPSFIWVKQSFTDFKLNLDCNIALWLMDEILQKFFYEDRFLSPFTTIRGYQIIENIPYRGYVVIKFTTTKPYEVADIFKLGEEVARVAMRFGGI